MLQFLGHTCLVETKGAGVSKRLHARWQTIILGSEHVSGHQGNSGLPVPMHHYRWPIFQGYGISEEACSMYTSCHGTLRAGRVLASQSRSSKASTMQLHRSSPVMKSARARTSMQANSVIVELALLHLVLPPRDLAPSRRHLGIFFVD